MVGLACSGNRAAKHLRFSSGKYGALCGAAARRTTEDLLADLAEEVSSCLAHKRTQNRIHKGCTFSYQ